MYRTIQVYRVPISNANVKLLKSIQGHYTTIFGQIAEPILVYKPTENLTGIPVESHRDLVGSQWDDQIPVG